MCSFSDVFLDGSRYTKLFVLVFFPTLSALRRTHCAVIFELCCALRVVLGVLFCALCAALFVWCCLLCAVFCSLRRAVVLCCALCSRLDRQAILE